MQTKLNKVEKQLVRDAVCNFKELGGDVFSFPDLGVTVAIAPAFQGSRMARASVAVMAPTETKFRRLVGMNIAMDVHEVGAGVPMVLAEEFWLICKEDQLTELEFMATDLAKAVAVG